MIINIPKNVKPLIILLFTLVSLTKINGQVCTVNSGPTQTYCETSPNFSLIGIMGAPLSPTPNPQWSQIDGPNITTIQNANSINATVSGFTSGSYSYEFSATCSDGIIARDTVVINISENRTLNGVTLSDLTICRDTTISITPQPGVSYRWFTSSTEGTAYISISSSTSSNPRLYYYYYNAGWEKIYLEATNGACVALDSFIVNVLGGPGEVCAGPDIYTCANSFNTVERTIYYEGSNACNSLADYEVSRIGNSHSVLWNQISGPNLATIANNTDPSTNFSNLIDGLYEFEFCVSGPCKNSCDTLKANVGVDPIGDPAFFLPDIWICDNTINSTIMELDGNFEPGTSFNWTLVYNDYPCNNSLIQISDPTAQRPVISWDPSCAYCDENYSQYMEFDVEIISPTGCSVISNIRIWINTAHADYYTETLSCGDLTISDGELFYFSDIIDCYPPNYSLSSSLITVIETPPGDLNFTVGNEITNPSGTVYYTLTPGDYVFRQCIELAAPSYVINGCNINVCETKTFQVSGENAIANAGTDAYIPCGQNWIELSGNPPPPLNTGSWYQISGPNTISFDNINDNTPMTTNYAPGIYELQWSIDGGPNCGQDIDQVYIYVADDVSSVNAGSDLNNECYGYPVSLNAELPSGWFGSWTVSPATGVVFSDPNAPNATIYLPNPSTTYTLTWTVTSICGTLSDQLQITTSSTQGPDQAQTNNDICTFCTSCSTTISAQTPTTGTGIWTQVSGPSVVTITDPNNTSTSVGPLDYGNYSFEWAVSNACATTRDTLIVSNISSTVNAPEPQYICGLTGNLIGPDNTSGYYSGQYWEKRSGPPGVQIIDPTDLNTAVVFSFVGTYVFRLHRGFASCASGYDDVTVYVSDLDGIPIVGPNQELCNSSSTTLSANAIPGAYWNILSATNADGTVMNLSLSDIYDPNASLQNMTEGEIVMTWNVISSPPNAECILQDTLLISNIGPATIIQGGEDICINEQSFILEGSSPTGIGIGLWTQTAGPSITIQNINPSGTIIMLTDLIPGNYSFEYSISSTGCNSNVSTSFTIWEYTEAIATAAPIACMSTITLNGNSGPPGSLLSWDKQSGPVAGAFSSTSTENTTYTGSSDNSTYIFEYQIINGACVSQDLVLVNTSFLTIDAGPNTQVCTNEQYTFNPIFQGGNGEPYNFDWSPSTSLDNPNIGNPTTTVGTTTTYEVTITDQMGCTVSDQITLTTDPLVPDANAGNDILLCGNSTITIGASPVTNSDNTYTWTDINGNIISSGVIKENGNPNFRDYGTLEVSPTMNTSYILYTDDGGGCRGVDTVHVFVGTPNVVSVEVDQPDACSPSNGAVTITGTGGNDTGYQYSIDNGLSWSDSNQFTNLSPGNYNIWIRNGDGSCPFFDALYILDDPTPDVSNVSTTTLSSCSANDGSITITASSSVGLSLEYSIDNGLNWQSSNLFTNLSEGNYQIYVRNDNGSCPTPFTGSVSITSPFTPLINSVTSTDSTCPGADDGTITILASGGNGCIEYSINSTDGLNGNWYSNGGNFNSLAQGSYTIWVRNCDNTCPFESDSNPIVISETPVPTGAISGSTNACTNQSTAAFSVTGLSNCNGCSYLWTSADGTPSTPNGSSTSFTWTSLGSKTINLQLTSSSNCTSTISYAVSVIDIPTSPVTISGPLTPCEGSSQSYSITTVSGASSYTWTIPADWTISSGQGTTTINVIVGASTGDVCVTADNLCGASSQNCLNVDPENVLTSIPIISGADAICTNQISNVYSITPVAGASSYTWTVPSGWTINSGQGTTSLNVDAGNSSGDICVSANNFCGSSIPSCITIEMLDVIPNPCPVLISQVSMPGSEISSGVSEINSGGGDYAWSNLGGAQTSDNVYTTVTLNKSTLSEYLDVTDFNFNIPCGASIKGIEVLIEKKWKGGTKQVYDNVVQLLHPLGSSTQNKAAISTPWSATDATSTYGGGSDTWSASWTLADINDPSFGIRIQAVAEGGSGSPSSNQALADIDFIQIRVHYTNAPDLCISNDIAFEVNSIPSATNYNWSTPLGTTIIAGSNTESIEVDMTGIAIGCYEVCLTVDNACGTSDQCCQYFNLIACPEICDNGIDDDLNGLTDCDDSNCNCCEAKAPTISKN